MCEAENVIQYFPAWANLWRSTGILLMSTSHFQNRFSDLAATKISYYMRWNTFSKTLKHNKILYFFLFCDLNNTSLFHPTCAKADYHMQLVKAYKVWNRLSWFHDFSWYQLVISRTDSAIFLDIETKYCNWLIETTVGWNKVCLVFGMQWYSLAIDWPERLTRQRRSDGIWNYAITP